MKVALLLFILCRLCVAQIIPPHLGNEIVNFGGYQRQYYNYNRLWAKLYSGNQAKVLVKADNDEAYIGLSENPGHDSFKYEIYLNLTHAEIRYGNKGKVAASYNGTVLTRGGTNDVFYLYWDEAGVLMTKGDYTEMVDALPPGQGIKVQYIQLTGPKGGDANFVVSVYYAPDLSE